MNAKMVFCGLALASLSVTAHAAPTLTPVASMQTAEFTISDAPCSRRSVAITAKVTNKAATPWNGLILGSPPQSATGGEAFSVPANGEASGSTKTGFNCEKTPLLNVFRATVKNASNGAEIASKGYRLYKLTYPSSSARPPSAGSGVKNVLYITSVNVEQAMCGQPIHVDVAGQSLMVDTPITASLKVDLVHTGASTHDSAFYAQPMIEKGATFSVRMVGPTLDCAIGAPVMKLKVTAPGTVPVDGAAAGAAELHPESETWVDESTPTSTPFQSK